ncbi:MAG TPA: plasmid mobilization relaxosome protein MobC [Thermoanaerobaculia bacterium]|nr:plasmid mobilization relaxosome protein MobC [Thermoanaerobaculia bacterium]
MARIKQLSIHVSAGEFLRLAAAAEVSAMTPTAWVRHQALRAADGISIPAPPFRPPPPRDPPAKLTRTAGTRFSPAQFEAIQEHARGCGLTVTAFIRQVVLGHSPTPHRPLARSAIVAVNRVGNNLNQLVHLANSGIVLAPDLMRAVAAVLAEIHALQDALFRADAADAAEPPG